MKFHENELNLFHSLKGDEKEILNNKLEILDF